MAKKDEYYPSQAEVDKIILMPKSVNLTDATWITSPPPNRVPMWMQMNLSPLDELGYPITHLRFILQYRPAQEIESGESSKLSIIALYRNTRIYALDPFPYDKHTNKAIVDHPDFSKSVTGAHYHLYFEHAKCDIGLKLQSNLAHDDVDGYWSIFCSKMNVTQKGRLVHPLELESGQLRLL
ncbi:hypothetical protein [Thorsellia kenyensis]|uniref:Uncharacterized protein n=1 Tax=Thorsellia kenyensis TaxID=1549888 RepID=A0ABV6C7Q1_9GAMM